MEEEFKEIISLELASAIFEEEVDYVDASIILRKEGTFLPIRFAKGNYHEFPLMFLVEKCKEWAIKKGYVTHSVRNLKEYVVFMSGDCRDASDDFRASNEFEALNEACEWILVQEKK